MSDVFTPAPEELGSNGEAMVTAWMEKNGVERDAAIGTLVMCAKGQGQPLEDMFSMFPELKEMYEANSVEKTGSEETVE